MDQRERCHAPTARLRPAYPWIGGCGAARARGASRRRCSTPWPRVESLLGWAVISPPWLTPCWRPLRLELDLRNAFLGEANLLGGSLGEVEVPAWHIRPTVINRHRDRLAGFEIGHFRLRPQRQRPMGRRQRVLIEG